MSDLRPFGKNLGGYFGERIDIRAWRERALSLARRHGWAIEELPAGADRALLTLRRAGGRVGRRIYISAGIHGDEPAGPLAMQQLLEENLWPENAEVWLCPCLNPSGCERHTRENAEGVDLNRDYRAPATEEVRAHVRWLERQPGFDFALCLHEDWEARGFYVYELRAAARDSLARRIVDAAAQVCPIDVSSEIDGWPAERGIISPAVDPLERPQWAEAIYLFAHRTPHTCTLEAPSDFSLAVRVRALVAGVRAALAE